MSNLKKVLDVLSEAKNDQEVIKNLRDKFKDFDEFLGYTWSKWIVDENTKKYLMDYQTELRKLSKTIGLS